MLRFPILGGSAALWCYVFQYFWRGRRWVVGKLPAASAQMLRFPRLGGLAALRCYWRLVQCAHVGGIVLDASRASADVSGWRVFGVPTCQIRRVAPLDLTGVCACVSMAPLVLHKLLRSLKVANAFWQWKSFGVSAGYSRMRSTRLAGMDGCLGTAWPRCALSCACPPLI